jgi:hypothetical protein
LKNPDRKAYKRHGTTKTLQVVDSIRSSLANDPFLSNFKLRQIIIDALNIKVSRELVRVAIKRLGLSKKKARSVHLTRYHFLCFWNPFLCLKALSSSWTMFHFTTQGSSKRLQIGRVLFYCKYEMLVFSKKEKAHDP